MKHAKSAWSEDDKECLALHKASPKCAPQGVLGISLAVFPKNTTTTTCPRMMEVALSSLFTISVSTALQWCCECTFHGVSEGSTYEGAAKVELACVGGSRSLQSIHDTNSRILRCCCQDMLTVVSYSVVLHSVAIPAMQFALWSRN